MTLGKLPVMAWRLAAAIGVSLSLTAPSLLPAAAGAERHRTESSLTASARRAMETAEAAWVRGEYDIADASLRQAWLAPELRAEAAARLHVLHGSAAFHLPVDEPAVEATREQLGPRFVRYETAHFVMLSDCDADWTRARGELLERARERFFIVAERMGIPAIPHEHKLLCVLFNRQDDYSRFAARFDGLTSAWVAGYYATGSNRIVFYNDAGSRLLADALDRLEARHTAAHDDDVGHRLHGSADDDRSRQIERERNRLREKAAAFSTAKTIHEAVHLLSFNTGVQRPDRDYPFWLSEGLATSFETEDADQGFGPEHASHRRQSRFEQMRRLNRLLPLREFLTLTEVPGNNADQAAVMYTQGHALFAHLYRHHREALGRYILAFASERGGRLTGPRQLDLFIEHFGDPEDIERHMLAAR